MRAMDASLQTLVDRVRAAQADGTPLRICGGGSKAFYGEPMAGEPLPTIGLRGIVSYAPSELVVTVRAGTPLAELEAVLAERGQCLPFEPPHVGFAGPGHTATVGGMVAAGLAGPARASVGGVRDHVLGLGLLDGRGQCLQFGGQVMKNVAGYDVSRVMAGALGTLGLVTEVSLKVLPVAPAEATLVLERPQAEALALLQRWGGQPLPLNASCWVRDETDGGRELLFVRLRGAAAAVEAACQRLLREHGGARMDNAVAQPDWAACRDLRLPFFTVPVAAGSGAAEPLALWRLGLPATAPVLDLPSAPFIEWHGAQRWVWAPPGAAARLRAVAARAGGHATLFWAPEGAAAAAAVPRFDMLAPALAQIHHRLKAEFDPAGVFNRGRLWPEPASTLASLT